jgi:hypothetical protein
MEMHIQLHASADLPTEKKNSLYLFNVKVSGPGASLGTLYHRKLPLPGIELWFLDLTTSSSVIKPPAIFLL